MNRKTDRVPVELDLEVQLGHPAIDVEAGAVQTLHENGNGDLRSPIASYRLGSVPQLVREMGTRPWPLSTLDERVAVNEHASPEDIDP